MDDLEVNKFIVIIIIIIYFEKSTITSVQAQWSQQLKNMSIITSRIITRIRRKTRCKS